MAGTSSYDSGKRYNPFLEHRVLEANDYDFACKSLGKIIDGLKKERLDNDDEVENKKEPKARNYCELDDLLADLNKV